jgi:hypothetical protein
MGCYWFQSCRYTNHTDCPTECARFDTGGSPTGYDDYDPHSTDNEPEPPCDHLFVSWHGSRGECQDCGETVEPTTKGELFDPHSTDNSTPF